MLPSRIFLDNMLRDFKIDNNMQCDIYEEDDKIVIEMDIPGFSKEDIKVECENDNIHITAEREESENENKKYIHKERKSYGKYERSFHFENIDEESIEAKFNNGILSVSVKKEKENKNRKQIEIK